MPLTIHEQGKSYQIKVSAKESLENLFHYLYDGVDESLYLERKYETFLQGLTKPSEKISYKISKLSLEPLCQLMKNERKRRGLSQEKLSEAMGISVSFLSNLERGKRGLHLDLWIPWCSALGISPSYVIESWQKMVGFTEIGRRQQMQNFAGKMATEDLEQLEEALEDTVRPIERSLVTPKPKKKELFEEEFTVRAIKKFRREHYKGIHTVYSGFNDAWRNHFGTDPIEGIQKLAQQGKIETRPAKGGAIIYLPGEGPGSKNVLDIILE